MRRTIWMPRVPGSQGGDGDGDTDGPEGNPFSSEWWIEYFNAKAWSTLKKRLQCAGALVGCTHECGIAASIVGDAGRCVADRGSKALTGPAEERAGGRTAMGGVVFARAFLGLRWTLGGRPCGHCCIAGPGAPQASWATL